MMPKVPDVIETAYDNRGRAFKMKVLKYPTIQTVTILTAHLRRWHVPRQINIRGGRMVRVKLYSEGVFSKRFKKNILKELTDKAYLCRHCLRGAWVYVRVGAKTYTVWLKGEGEDMSYLSLPSNINSITYT